MKDYTAIGTLKESQNRSPSEIIAEIAKKDLDLLNPDYQIAFHEVGAEPDSGQSIKFGSLPIEEQEAIRKALSKLAGLVT